MTVAELIEKLNEYPKEAKVEIFAEGGYVSVEADMLYRAKGELYKGEPLKVDTLLIGDY